MSTTQSRAAGWTGASIFVLVALLLIALLLRAPIASVPPALAVIAEDLSLNPTALGLATTLPLLCFGAFAFLAPALAARFGMQLSLLGAVALIVAGIVVRSIANPWWFFIGITVIGLGIALGNVIIPALIRAEFPTRLALLMGLYSLGLQLGAGAGSAATAPLLAAGLGWQSALGIWVLVAGLALVLWGVVTARSHRPATGPRARVATPMGVVGRRPLTLAICVVMGLQSLAFYSLLTWIPKQLTDQGVSATSAGLLLGLFSVLGLPGSFLGPRFAQSSWGPLAIIILFGVDLIGVVLLMFGPVAAIIGTILAGLCQGAALSTALTFIAHQAEPADVPAVSALAQGIGYGLAALGPVLLGALYQATGAWVLGNLFLVASFIAVALIGAWISRTEQKHAAYRLRVHVEPTRRTSPPPPDPAAGRPE